MEPHTRDYPARGQGESSGCSEGGIENPGIFVEFIYHCGTCYIEVIVRCTCGIDMGIVHGYSPVEISGAGKSFLVESAAVEVCVGIKISKGAFFQPDVIATVRGTGQVEIVPISGNVFYTVLICSGIVFLPITGAPVVLL